MKLLFIIPSYKPAYIYGGPILSVSNLAEALVAAGNEVTVFTTTANGLKELEVIPGKHYTIEGVEVYYFRRFSKGHSNFSPGLLKELYRKAPGFDIIHIHSWWNLVTVPATLISIIKGITPIISPRGTLTEYSFTHRRNILKRAFHKIAGKQILNRSIFAFTSERERDDAFKYVNASNTYIIPNLLNLPNLIPGAHKESQIFRILFLGRIDAAKNIEFLFKVLGSITEFPFECIIAGEGKKAYTDHLKRISSPIRGIKWIGLVEGDKKFKYLAEADLLALPSHTENYGNVIFEALCQGTAVIVSTNVGSKDYILEHRLGWVVELDEGKWREALTSIWMDNATRKDIRVRAPICIAKDFNGNQQLLAYDEMYQHVKHLRKE